MENNHGKPRVLLVDDDNTLCALLAVRFKATYELHILSSADGWEHEIENFSPQAIILDLMLPRMSGIELCRRIRQHPNGINVPILILSAASFADIQDGMRAGANRFLAKPFDTEILKCILNELILGSWKSSEPDLSCAV